MGPGMPRLRMPGEAAGSGGGGGAAIRHKYEAKLQAKRMKAMRRNEKLGLREGDVLCPDAWSVRPGAPQLLRCSSPPPPPPPLHPLSISCRVRSTRSAR